MNEWNHVNVNQPILKFLADLLIIHKMIGNTKELKSLQNQNISLTRLNGKDLFESTVEL